MFLCHPQRKQSWPSKVPLSISVASIVNALSNCDLVAFAETADVAVATSGAV